MLALGRIEIGTLATLLSTNFCADSTNFVPIAALPASFLVHTDCFCSANLGLIPGTLADCFASSSLCLGHSPLGSRWGGGVSLVHTRNGVRKG